MSITDELRKSFEQCTFKAGIAPDEFDTVWITKSCVLSMLDGIDAAFEAGHSRAVEYGKKIGRETCHVECFDDGIDEGLDGEPVFTSPTWYLSCGHTTQDSERPNFCPVCGKVVDG